MIKNLFGYLDENEYSVNLHLVKMPMSEETVMFITVTTISGGMDYTVIFNGLPTPKNLKKASCSNAEVAKLIIKSLKDDVTKYAIKYWNFDKDEWLDNLDKVLEDTLAE